MAIFSAGTSPKCAPSVGTVTCHERERGVGRDERYNPGGCDSSGRIQQFVAALGCGAHVQYAQSGTFCTKCVCVCGCGCKRCPVFANASVSQHASPLCARACVTRVIVQSCISSLRSCVHMAVPRIDTAPPRQRNAAGLGDAASIPSSPRVSVPADNHRKVPFHR